MYIALEVDDKSATIYDTKDGSTEVVNIESVKQILAQEVEIVGLTESLAEIGVLSKVLLHFQFIRKEFNGFYLTGYSDLSEDCLAQVIEIGLNDLMDVDTFLFLAKYMRDNNRKYYSFKQRGTELAFVQDYYPESDTFDITCPDGELLNFMYCDILYSVFEEDYRVDRISVNNDTLSLEFDKNRQVTYTQGMISVYNAIKSEIEDLKNEFKDQECLAIFGYVSDMSMDNIDTYFERFPNGIRTQSFGIPLCNIKNRVLNGEISYRDPEVVLEGRTIKVAGKSLDPTNQRDLYAVRKAIQRGTSEEFIKQLNVLKSKSIFLNREFDKYGILECNLEQCNLDTFNEITKRGQTIMTKYGDIQINRSRYIDCGEFSDYLFLNHWTRLGQLYYDTHRRGLYLGASSVTHTSFPYNINYYDDFVRDCVIDGRMFPFCMSDICWHGKDGICISIDFLFNSADYVDYQGELMSYGYSVITIPLLISPLSIIYDFSIKKYKIDTMLEEIIIDKGVFEHLSGYKMEEVVLNKNVQGIKKSSKTIRELRTACIRDIQDSLSEERREWFDDNCLEVDTDFTVQERKEESGLMIMF